MSLSVNVTVLYIEPPPYPFVLTKLAVIHKLDTIVADPPIPGIKKMQVSVEP